jgi:hypothetical protein
LQRSSFHLQRREEIAQIKPGESSSLYTPTQLMTPTLRPCDQLARVLGRSQRFIFCESGFKFYGGSQEALAQLRGLSQATVSRHLSNKYRLAATPIRGFRQELPPIIKKQLVERHPNLKNMPPKICLEDGLFRMNGDWWEPHCNVYYLSHRLVSARRRRAAFNPQSISGSYESKKVGVALNKKKDNKISLSNAIILESGSQDSKHFKSFKKEKKTEEKQKCPPGEGKKPGEGKTKMITAQQ